ncbi:Homeobox-like domain superfamily [Sesbania bispinosa]|nr:Homeobox-like domain superfamily [Sesbania bispinosa]
MEDFMMFSFKTQEHRAKHNKRLTEDQVAILENCFASNKKLEPKQKFQLANQLGVPPRQIAIWYQNKRARWKTQTLEHDYNALQSRLENVMAEKKQLERDVECLKVELKKAQEMMLISMKGNASSCEFSTSFEEGSGGMHDDEELYAYFMAANGSSNLH